MSDGGKRLRTSESTSENDKVTRLEDIPSDQKVAILEQRLQEFQALTFDKVFGDQNECTVPTKLYVDPLLNTELSILHQKIEILSKLLVSNTPIDTGNTDALIMKELKEEIILLKQQNELLNPQLIARQVEVKDRMINDLLAQLNASSARIKDLEDENEYLSEQIMILQTNAIRALAAQHGTDLPEEWNDEMPPSESC